MKIKASVVIGDIERFLLAHGHQLSEFHIKQLVSKLWSVRAGKPDAKAKRPKILERRF